MNNTLKNEADLAEEGYSSHYLMIIQALAGSRRDNIAPNHAPTRIIFRAGTNSFFLKTLINSNLIKLEKTGKRRTHVSITERGRTLLQHYRICNELLLS
jgi:predicted transcriptional regulator